MFPSGDLYNFVSKKMIYDGGRLDTVLVLAYRINSTLTVLIEPQSPRLCYRRHWEKIQPHRCHTV